MQWEIQDSVAEEKLKKKLSNSDLATLFLFVLLPFFTYFSLAFLPSNSKALKPPPISVVEFHGPGLLLYNHFDAFSVDSETAMVAFLFFCPINPSRLKGSA